MAAPAARHTSTRTKARKRALDVLFEADLRGLPVLDVLAAHVAQAEPPVRPFTEELVRGFESDRGRIDRLIAECLTGGWTLERMPRVDRNLARIAVHEILHTDLAPEVALAECVALGEDLSTDDSPVFLNGLLRAVADRFAAGTA
jgi:N utilization substance protein B